MAVSHGFGKIVTDGLVLALDAADTNSYTSGSTTWRDMSGNGNNGTLTNGPTFDSANGGSIVFDGANDWLTIPGADSLVKGQTKMSMGVMVKFTSLSFLGVVIGVPRYSCTRNIVISTFENGNIRFYNDDTVTCRAVDLAGYAELNKWIYLVGTFDGTTTSLYGIKDGVLTSTSNTLVTGSTNTFEDYNVFGIMGRNSNYNGGSLASAFIYHKALTATEILQNYNTLKPRFGL